MRAFFSSAIVIGMVFLSIGTAGAQVTGNDPDYIPPRIVKTPYLTPPKEAVESGLGGVVRVEVSIDEAGNVTSAKEARGPGAVCQQVTRPDIVAMRNAARDAAYLAKFTPATRKGKPVDSSTWLNFKFPGAQEKTNVAAAPVGEEKTNSAAVAPAESSADGAKYTVKSDINFSAAIAPPPDYRGPVNTTGAKTSSKGVPKQISGGVLNGKATSLPRPSYPPAAHAVGAAGAVTIQVLIDENGDVFSAQAVSGHPLLRATATFAACEAKFSPTQLAGNPVKVSGVITYNFVP